MRKRFKRSCIASSDNYKESRLAHIAMLNENHEKNSALFLTISTIPTPTLTDLQLFELGVKRQIAQFKLNN